MEIYAWVVTLPLCFRRFYTLTMPTHQKITHGWLACNAAHLKVRHLFSHLQVHKISSHTSHKCLYSEAAPAGVFLMHQEGSGLGVVLWVTKNHQQASIARLAGVQIFQSIQLYPTWETSSTLERFWCATVATAGGHRFRLFKGGI